jgi:hypothetical protein
VRSDLLRVHVRSDIALDDRDAIAVAQRVNGGEDRRGLAGARACHEIDHEDAVLGEELAVALRQRVVLLEDPPGDVDAHGCS